MSTSTLNRYAAQTARWERRFAQRRRDAIARARRDGRCAHWSESNGRICGRDAGPSGECESHAAETAAYVDNFHRNGGR